MNFKTASCKFLMSIPHLAFFWDMRRYQRYEPREGLDIEIKSKDKKIYAVLIDICFGGMRIVSTDTRMDDSKRISLSMADYCIELPCQKIRKVQYYYGIVFGRMNNRELSKLGYFINHCTKELPSIGPIEIMR